MAIESIDNELENEIERAEKTDGKLTSKFKDLRQKVKDSIDPYLEGEITDFENGEDEEKEDLLDLDEFENELNEFEDKLENTSSERDSDENDDWDKWVFNNKLSPPPARDFPMSELDDDYFKRFDPDRSSHLWKSDPEVPEYRAFGSLKEKNNNVLAANLRKYQNETLSPTA